MQWLKHAFAVDPPGPAEPTDEQRLAIDRVVEEVVRRGLATPTLIALEMGRPLNFLGSQALHFFSPFLSVFANTSGYRHFAKFLELRGSIPFICDAIEERLQTNDTPSSQAATSAAQEIRCETD